MGFGVLFDFDFDFEFEVRVAMLCYAILFAMLCYAILVNVGLTIRSLAEIMNCSNNYNYFYGFELDSRRL